MSKRNLYGWKKNSCTECTKGTYNSTIGLDTECTNCPAGQFSDSNGATICQKCPEGHISNEGSSSCTICEPGKGPNSSHTKCEDCKIGYFSNETTGGSCVTFDSNCPVSQRFGGSQTGLKKCPEKCKQRQFNFTETPINTEPSVRYENNIPFVNRRYIYRPKKGENDNLVYPECETEYDCTPGGLGYKCDNGTCTADVTKNYDELQEIFYDSDIRSGQFGESDWKTYSIRSCGDLYDATL